MLSVRTATSTSADPEQIAADLFRDVGQDDASVVLFFASPRLAADRLAAALHRAFAPTPTLGCTTSGEIGAGGFGEDSVVAMSLRCRDLRVGWGTSMPIGESPLTKGRDAALAALSALGLKADELSRQRHVAVSLIDGRSQKEESFVAGAAAAIPQIEVVGGSASDYVDEMPKSRIFADGKALSAAGMIIIFETDVPFAVVMSSHMTPTDKRVVVTASAPARRIVEELNGRPALEVYQELLGIEEIDNAVAGRNPFVQMLGGRSYVRSVMAVAGTSLQFACAVEDGVILRLAEPGDLLATTRTALASAERAVGGEVEGVIAFNCLGRYLEAEAVGQTRALGDIYRGQPLIGFNTFGEQAGALHVNHTLTALVFGKEPT